MSARHAAAAGLAAAALLLPVRSLQQLLFAASLAVALGTMGLWGRRFSRTFLGVPDPGPCTAVYLGQFVLLAAATLATAVNGTMAALLGRSLPLLAIVLPASLVVLALEARATVRAAEAGEADPPDLLGVLALGCASVVIAIWARHLSALGLDTHQHVALVRQIVARGFVPLAEPGTGILGDYPRTFHLLAALWNSAGLGTPAGPWVKVLPFLQSALPALALGELLIVAAGTRSAGPDGDESRARRRWRISVGLAFWAYAFLVVPMVYPAADLSGTPRISSNGLLLLPVVLAVLSSAHRAAPAAALALGALPLVGAWALTWNPITPVLLGVATGPLLLAVWAVLKPAWSRRGAAAAFASCSALALVVVVQDPWVVSQAALRSPAIAALLRRGDLVGYDEAVRAGRASPRDKAVSQIVQAAPCRDAACVARAVFGASRETVLFPAKAARVAAADLREFVRSPSVSRLAGAFGRVLPIAPSSVAAPAVLPVLLVVACGVSIALRRAIRRRKASGLPGATPAERLLVASVEGNGAVGLGMVFSAELSRGLSDQGHDAQILVNYLHGAGRAVSIGFLWVPFLAAWSVIVEPFVTRSAAEGIASRVVRRGGAGLALAGIVLWLGLPLAARLNLDEAIGHAGFFNPIGLGDLRALRRVEEAIPPPDLVLVPAQHWNIADWEHWVIPVTDTAALLPYGDRKYLFNVYLGASYPFSWHDLEDGLCRADPAARARFLEKAGARWLMVRDTIERDPEQVVKHVRICGERLDTIGAVLPPERAEGGIFLFRLREPAQVLPGRPPTP